MSAVPEGNQDLAVRVMTDADLSEVLEIERQSYGFPWAPGIFQDCLRVGYACWVAEKDGRLLGYLIMSMAAGEAHVLNLCVGPASRRQGIGRRLLAHAMSVAHRCGVDSMFLEVRPSNRSALGLYEAIGFHEVGLRPAYYPMSGGRREDGVIMACSLGSADPLWD